MEHETRDTYIIPPNFIEGGTLLGGMFRTRNVIEAVVLALAVGLPVLGLGFSLTTRIILLCLTALPLALLALIGISGNSLSAFLLLFVHYLRNRRILSRDTPIPARKSILPSWARGPSRQVKVSEDEQPLKSRSRVQVDFKGKQVIQFKTFLPPEDEVKPLNPLSDYIPIERIENGVIYTRGHRYVKVVEVVPVNFLLRSAREQRNIIYSFISYRPGAVQGAVQAGGHQPPYRDHPPGVGAGDRPPLPCAARGLPEAHSAFGLQRSHYTPVLSCL